MLVPVACIAALAWARSVSEDARPRATAVGARIIACLCLLSFVAALVCVVSGESEYELFARAGAVPSPLQQHADAAELLPWMTAATLLLSLAALKASVWGARARVACFVLSVLGACVAYGAGVLGGELVHVHGSVELKKRL